MCMKKVLSLSFLLSFLLSAAALARNCDTTPSRSLRNSHYDAVYSNPRRQSLEAWGRYIYSNSRVRYVNSPSKMKRAAHAARIEAYNVRYENY